MWRKYKDIHTKCFTQNTFSFWFTRHLLVSFMRNISLCVVAAVITHNFQERRNCRWNMADGRKSSSSIRFSNVFNKRMIIFQSWSWNCTSHQLEMKFFWASTIMLLLNRHLTYYKWYFLSFSTHGGMWFVCDNCNWLRGCFLHIQSDIKGYWKREYLSRGFFVCLQNVHEVFYLTFLSCKFYWSSKKVISAIVIRRIFLIILKCLWSC